VPTHGEGVMLSPQAKHLVDRKRMPE
jgi:hypothetical protein